MTTEQEPTDRFAIGKQEPVIKAGAQIAFINSIVVMAVDALASYFNVTPELRLFLMAALPALVVAYFVVRARNDVTPNSNPRTVTGEPLIPLSQAIETITLQVGGEAIPEGTAVRLE